VRSCHYDDVHVMWSMLQQSRYPLGSPKRHCRIARIFEWWVDWKSEKHFSGWTGNLNIENPENFL
jgi:hypothetical protein